MYIPVGEQFLNGIRYQKSSQNHKIEIRSEASLKKVCKTKVNAVFVVRKLMKVGRKIQNAAHTFTAKTEIFFTNNYENIFRLDDNFVRNFVVTHFSQNLSSYRQKSY